MENEKSFITYRLKKIVIETKNNLMTFVTDSEVNSPFGNFGTITSTISTEKFSFLQDAKDAIKNITPKENSVFIRDDDIPQIISIVKNDNGSTTTTIIGIIEE